MCWTNMYTIFVNIPKFKEAEETTERMETSKYYTIV